MIKVIKQRSEIFVTSKLAIYMMTALIFAAALFYVYFANMAVRTLTALEKTKKDMQALTMRVSDMESERLAAQNSVNTNLAFQLGFVEVNHPTFIMKTAQKAALSFKTN